MNIMPLTIFDSRKNEVKNWIVIKRPGNYRHILGKKIRMLRDIARMTQMDLANALGYTSTGMISQIEAGAKGMDPEKIIEAARIFDVHPSVLISDVDMAHEDIEMFVNLSMILKSKHKAKHVGAIRELLKLSADKSKER